MVTTRSGRQTLSAEASKPFGKHLVLKPIKPSAISYKAKAPAFKILEDNDLSPKDLPLPVPMTIPPMPPKPPCSEVVKPTQPAITLLNDENVNTINIARPTNVVDMSKTVKIIGVSDAEKKMNGAPVGALYEVTVCEDTALQAYANDEEALSQLQMALETYKSSEVWADKFEAITTMRRCARHFPQLLDQRTRFVECLDAALDGISSLRSTTVKNALLSLKTLISNAWAKEAEEASRITTSMANRLASAGPKFLIDFAFTVAELAAASLPCEYFVPAMQKFLSHRSLEIQRKAGVLIAASVDRVKEQMTEELVIKVIAALVECATKVTNQMVQQKSAALLLAMKQLSGDRWNDIVLSQISDESQRKGLERALGLLELKVKS